MNSKLCYELVDRKVRNPIPCRFRHLYVIILTALKFMELWMRCGELLWMEG